MKLLLKFIVFTGILLIPFTSCNNMQESTDNTKTTKRPELTAKDILGNPEYRAISYGGYRQNSREQQPSVAEIKEDMRILYAMGIRLLRTYNTKLKHASTLLAAIKELKEENPNFEMYVMLGAWIDCKDAFTANPDHEGEDAEANAAEIERAVDMAKQYPDIVKIIAVGNEAMVKWAASYFVQADIILKWVNHLQDLKKAGDLPADLWVTSSDNFASWGGGGTEYHTEDLENLIRAVDFISLHTYPMHDTHYNPDFWGTDPDEGELSDLEKIEEAMTRALAYAITQYQNTADYIRSVGVDKPIHIGETGWASSSNEHYGPEGSKATDEYKSGLYHRKMRDWSEKEGISCFYFEAFDENWKDSQNPGGSENHFGLFTIDGKAKYAIWDLVDKGIFEGLGRSGQSISKTYGGDQATLLEEVLLPPVKELEAVQ